jgi:hypothetical protein
MMIAPRRLSEDKESEASQRYTWNKSQKKKFKDDL